MDRDGFGLGWSGRGAKGAGVDGANDGRAGCTVFFGGEGMVRVRVRVMVMG
jgi:hypothetical protein